MSIQTDTAFPGFTGCDNVPDAMAGMTAASRFILRVQEYIDKGVRQKDLKGPNSEGWISNILKARRGLSLNDAEMIAEALKVPLAELLRRPDDAIYELDNLEGRLIEAYRALARPEQEALLTLATLRQRQGTAPASRRVPALQSPSRGTVDERRTSTPLPQAVLAILAKSKQDIETWYAAHAGRQVADSRPKVAVEADSHRSLRGSAHASKR